jgi:hypothetical protein
LADSFLSTPLLTTHEFRRPRSKMIAYGVGDSEARTLFPSKLDADVVPRS